MRPVWDDDEETLTRQQLLRLVDQEVEYRRWRRRRVKLEEHVPRRTISKGDVWTVEDQKVHFDGRRPEEQCHEGSRPGAIVVEAAPDTLNEVCWVPGSSRIAGRDPAEVVVHEGTAFLVKFYSWFKEKTLISRKYRLPMDVFQRLECLFHRLQGD